MTENSSLIGVDGKRIAFLGHLNFKKGPMLLIHALATIVEHDSEFSLHIAGAIQDPRAAVYLDHCIPELGLQDNIQYYGSMPHEQVLDWLKTKDYIINSSPLEGCPVGVIEGMSQGLTPLLHSFAGASGLYPPDFIWSSIPELIEMIKKDKQPREKYINFVKKHFNLEDQITQITAIVDNLASNTIKKAKKQLRSTVSCVIAVKGGALTIERAIDSVLEQSYKVDKIVVVDDCSTDNTKQIVEGYAVKSNSNVPIEVISLTENKWVFSARNEGIKHVNTDYFFFLDADDYISSTYVEKTVKMMDVHTQVAVAYTDTIYFDDEGVETPYKAPAFDSQTLVERNFIAYSSMQRTHLFNKLGGFSDYLNDSRNHLTEWELWLRYMQNNMTIKYCPQPVFYYYSTTTSEQMSKSYERPRQDMHIQMATGLVQNVSDIKMGEGGGGKLLLVCQGKDYLDKSKVGFELFQWTKPLEKFGAVFVFQYDVEVKHFGMEGMINRLIEFTKLLQPMCIFHPYYKEIVPKGVWETLTKDCITLLWQSDEWRYDQKCIDYEKAFAYSATTYPSVYEKMEHPGKLLSQWGANEHYFYPRDKDINVSFTGQSYGDRKELLLGLDVECYGLGWSNGFISFTEMAAVLGRSKISISFSKGAKGRQLKLRPFEITASNALCLCENMPGIEKYFIPGEEIILFDTKEELVENIKYYLAHEERRKEIAQAGYERTIKEHLWKHRITELFKSMGGKLK